MKVVDLSYGREDSITRIEELFERHHTTRGLAEALAPEVGELRIVRRMPIEKEVDLNGVHYSFFRSNWRGRWYVPAGLHRQIAASAPDIVHLHGLLFPLQLRALRLQLPARSAIVVQHHAERPSHGIRLAAQRTFLPLADGFFFTSVEQADPWIEAGIIPDRSRVYPVLEGSTGFTHQPREDARRRTGVTGDPVLLWVGRLNDNKDPLTVLGGFERLGEHLPGARLHMIFHEEPLLGAVKERIEGSGFLRRAVVLRGKVEREEIRDWFNSADYFVLGSHYEACGFSLLEALACGCVPVVTSIASFREITGNGKVGALWKPGDEKSFASALLKAIEKPLAEESSECVRHFRTTLSYPAIARTTERHYRQILSRRRGEAGSDRSGER
jgi:glycosyltransferase involved in cell wall biosynthesis